MCRFLVSLYAFSSVIYSLFREMETMLLSRFVFTAGESMGDECVRLRCAFGISASFFTPKPDELGNCGCLLAFRAFSQKIRQLIRVSLRA